MTAKEKLLTSFAAFVAALLVYLGMALPNPATPAAPADSVAIIAPVPDTVTKAPAPVETPKPTPAPATPAPAPTPIPAPTVPSSSAQLAGDDFTTYTTTAALAAVITKNAGGTGTGAVLYRDGADAGLVALDTAVTYHGHRTIRYDQPSGKTPKLIAYLPHTITNMWLRVHVRWSPGWTDVGPNTNAANAYKLLGWAWAGTDGRGTIELTNTTDYVFNWVITTKDGSRISPIAEKLGPRVTSEWTDGRWYEIIVHYQQTSPTTVTQSWWLAPDGTPPVLRATITGTMTQGTVPPLDRVMIGLNINQAVAKPQAMWWGDWSVVDGSHSPNPFGVQ